MPDRAIIANSKYSKFSRMDMEDPRRKVGKPLLQTYGVHELQDPEGTNGV